MRFQWLYYSDLFLINLHDKGENQLKLKDTTYTV